MVNKHMSIYRFVKLAVLMYPLNSYYPHYFNIEWKGNVEQKEFMNTVRLLTNATDLFSDVRNNKTLVTHTEILNLIQFGNIIQAVLSGIIHTLLFMIITTNLFFLIFIFIFPSIGAYLSVYLNEKIAEGSIIPGWISHAGANLISYSLVGFLI